MMNKEPVLAATTKRTEAAGVIRSNATWQPQLSFGISMRAWRKRPTPSSGIWRQTWSLPTPASYCTPKAATPLSSPSPAFCAPSSMSSYGN